MKTRLLISALSVVLVGVACAMAKSADRKTSDAAKTILFQEDFQSGLGQWKLAIDAGEDRPALDKQTEKARVHIVAAPDSAEGRRAVRCVVPRAIGSFRAEIAQPPETGFHERWYGARIYVPKDWVFGGGDIVMQWKGLVSKEKLDKAYPPLSLALKDDHWAVNQSSGAMDNIDHDTKVLDPVEKGRWVSWVVHVRWSSGADGLTEIWKDGKQVLTTKGANTYSTKPITPCFKTGLYHPAWKKKNADKFNEATTTVVERVIYVADIKIGSEKATYTDVAPKP